MHFRSLKYTTPLILYAVAFYAFLSTGWPIFIPLILIWILVPLAELMIKPNEKNLAAAEEELPGSRTGGPSDDRQRQGHPPDGHWLPGRQPGLSEEV